MHILFLLLVSAVYRVLIECFSGTMDSVRLINDVDVESGEEVSIKDDFAYRNNVANANVQIRLGKALVLF